MCPSSRVRQRRSAACRQGELGCPVLRYPERDFFDRRVDAAVLKFRQQVIEPVGGHTEVAAQGEIRTSPEQTRQHLFNREYVKRAIESVCVGEDQM